MPLMQNLKKTPAVLQCHFWRDRIKALSHGDPLYKVHYLGTEKIYSLDLEQAQDAIGRLLEGAPGKLEKEHALVVRPRYIEVKEISTGRQLTKTFLQDIACCAADSTRPNVFLYICRQHSRQLQCCVFWCHRAEQAKNLTTCLANAFQRALSDWQSSTSNQLQQECTKAVEFSTVANPKSRSTTVPAYWGKGDSLEGVEPSMSPSSDSDPKEGPPQCWRSMHQGCTLDF
ncbi:protein FAM43B-like isoform X1 [Arapaima gigas]